MAFPINYSVFLKARKQKVTINGQVSSWTVVNAGGPHESILCSLLFLVYSNDLVDGLSSVVCWWLNFYFR